MTVIRRNPASVLALEARALRAARTRARADLEHVVGRIRRVFITDLPGQGEIYAAKEREAQAYIALPLPARTLAGFRFLAAEVGITAPDPYALAQLWLNMADLWREIAATLETARIGANGQIDGAISADGARATAARAIASLEAAFAAQLGQGE